MKQFAAVLQFPNGVVLDEEADRILPRLEELVLRIEGAASRIEVAVTGDRLKWTDADVAAMFLCSEEFIAEERRAGKIEFKRVGRKAFYSRKHIEDYLASS